MNTKIEYVCLLVTIAILLIFSGCTRYTTRVDNTAGRSTIYVDPATGGPVAGIGIESQDITSMTDKMVRDMLASPVLAGQRVPPRIIIDAQYFMNESSSRINKNLITDRLRSELNRAAASPGPRIEV